MRASDGPRRLASLLLVAALSSVGGCKLFAPMRVEDGQAPADFYREVSQSQKPCSHSVRLLRAGQVPEQPYDELSLLSSTCSPSSPGLCDRILLERGCERGADAVLVLEPEAGGTPRGASTLSQISKNGKAVRYRAMPADPYANQPGPSAQPSSTE